MCCMEAKDRSLALTLLAADEPARDLEQTLHSPPPSPAVNEGRAFRVAAEPRTDQTQRIERQRFVAAKRCELTLLRRCADCGA
jgi:hypothetical protein